MGREGRAKGKIPKKLTYAMLWKGYESLGEKGFSLYQMTGLTP